MSLSSSVCLSPFFSFSVFGVCSALFHESFKGASRKFRGCFKEVLRVFQGNFKGVSRKFQGCFIDVSRTFQESFKDISRNFQGCLKEV